MRKLPTSSILVEKSIKNKVQYQKSYIVLIICLCAFYLDFFNVLKCNYRQKCSNITAPVLGALHFYFLQLAMISFAHFLRFQLRTIFAPQSVAISD